MRYKSSVKADFSGQRVLIMGLGLHGGGLEAARFLAERGAEVCVTDLRDEKTLAPSIEKLSRYSIRFVLGKHEQEDFKKADFVVKNPAVRPDSPFLLAARHIETDISLFLQNCPARILAVSGSKGKSGTVSALHWSLKEIRLAKNKDGNPLLPGKAYLGGNITVSPLSFLDELEADDDVVLELSSWQLGDLRGRLKSNSTEALLKPRIAILTAIMADHQDRYGSMEAYVSDKKIIYQGQDKQDASCLGDDFWGKQFAAETPGRPLIYGYTPVEPGQTGAWLEGTDGPGYVRLADGSKAAIVSTKPLVPGRHQKMNLLAAGLGLIDLGLPPELVYSSLERFPGIEHRLEFFYEAGGIRYYNDTAATIPEAAAAAIEAFSPAPILVCGGTDKALDFSPLANAAPKAKALVLLAGSGTEKLRTLLDTSHVTYEGPFDSVEKALNAAKKHASGGDSIVLSPGCASFGMFLNEFDRGRKWKEAVIKQG